MTDDTTGAPDSSSAPQYGRRAIHASGGLVPGIAVAGGPWSLVQAVSVALALSTLGLEALRLGGVVEWDIYDRLTRPYERENVAGYALYGVGFAVVAVAFPQRIAVPAMFTLALGDPVSGFLGRNQLQDAKRPLALAGIFGTAFVLCYTALGFGPALAGATVATLADGIKPRIRGHVVDDNLTIPIGTALALWAWVTVAPL